jgi:hypothetical protein
VESVEGPRLRDSFALDYMPDYDPDNLIEGEMGPDGGLNQSALDKL